MMLRTLFSTRFPPFNELYITFPKVEKKPEELAEVHVLTGINGTGKSRLLSILAAFYGNAESLTWRTRGEKNIIITGRAQNMPLPEIKSSANAMANLVHVENILLKGTPNENAVRSEALAYAYSGAPYIQDATIQPMAAISPQSRAQSLSFKKATDQSTLLLQAVSNLKMQAAMEALEREENPNAPIGRATKLTKSIEKTLANIIGQSFAFSLTAYPNPKIAARLGSAPLNFNSLPDGLRSILGWLVHAAVMIDATSQGRISPSDAEAIFLLDEIDQNLHPAWQRKVLPAFQLLFPKSVIIVATHSPFVISSLNHGWIHNLKQGAEGSVTIQSTPASAGDSYISVIEDIMGVKEWYDPETENLLQEFKALKTSVSKENPKAYEELLTLAQKIASRSIELSYIMGAEIKQIQGN